MLKGVLPWYAGGVFLALAFFLAVFLMKPIGVSTQFVIANAAVWDVVQPDVIVADETAKSGYSSSNAYLNKNGGKYAENAANILNYSFVFVIAMMGGALLSSLLKGDRPQTPMEQTMPPVWQNRFGNASIKRYGVCFLAGFIVLFGARLAGGCTSGHMMSGMMQTALSGYIFALGAFATAIPLAVLIFNKKS